MRGLVVAIAGGSGAGKTTFARKLRNALGRNLCALISQDSYYVDQSAQFLKDGGGINFDHPTSLDLKLLAQDLRDLKCGKDVEIPIYDFTSHQRLEQGATIHAKPFVIVDGTLLLSEFFLLTVFDFTIYIDVAEDIRFERRLKRDIHERGRSALGVKEQWENHVVPMHHDFVEPARKNASMIIGGEEDLDSCIKLLLSHR